MQKKYRIVVLISGRGSNLQAIVEACLSGIINGAVCAVISSNQNALGLERAAKFNIPSSFIAKNTNEQRKNYDKHLCEVVRTYQPDLIVLAGYMKILNADFISMFRDKIVNIHPSLLPKYPGLNTHLRAINAKDKKSGATVHFVTEELDGGPIIMQGSVPIFSNDSSEQLSRRVLEIEHIMLVTAISLICAEKIKKRKDTIYFENKKLSKKGISFNHLMEQR